jgi:hypothetical protein
MNTPLQRLINYYESSMFRTEFERVQAGDPIQARAARSAITSQLDANLKALGVETTIQEAQLREDFNDGKLSFDAMLEHVKRYVGTIISRYGNERPDGT